MASNDFSGDWLYDLDGTAHYSPASPILASMLSSGQAKREQSTLGSIETDNLAVNVDRTYLVRLSRTYENQVLLANFSFHAHQISNYVIRLQHRTLATVYTLAEAMSSCGMVAPTLSDSAFSGTGNTADWTAMNTALAPFGIQIWRA